MIQTMKITSKRQATLPVRLCKEMSVVPGDELLLERKQIHGKATWIIMPKKSLKKSWFGSLRKYASSKSHDINEIRKSIGNKNRKSVS